MIRLTNPVLIGLISASLLIGCGSSDSDTDTETTEQVEQNEDNEGTNETTDNTVVSGTVTFSESVMPILYDECKSCHGDKGNFTITDAAGTYANIIALPGGAQYMLGKGNNDIAHGGGDELDDMQYTTIKSWIDAGAANN